MSTGIAEDVLDIQDEASEPRHTTPTSEELAKLVHGAPAMIGGRRDGSMFCDIILLDEGYAYRQYGQESAEWQWLRTEDFERAFVAWGIVDIGAIKTLVRQLASYSMQWETRCRQLIAAMGTKSRRRFGKKLIDKIAGK